MTPEITLALSTLSAGLSLPRREIDTLLNIIFPWDILGLTPFGKRFVIRIFATCLVCVYLGLYFHSVRVDFSLPITYFTLIMAFLAGPVPALTWCIFGIRKKWIASKLLRKSFNIDPPSGFVGNEITVSGNGFAANSRVTLTMDNHNLITDKTEVKTDTTGNLKIKLKIPPYANGEHNIKVQDSAGNSAMTTLTVKCKMTTDALKGSKRTPIKVKGSGFAASSELIIYLDNSPVATNPRSIMTNGNGNFAAIFSIYTVSQGKHEVLVMDANGNSDTSTLYFKKNHSWTIIPNAGNNLTNTSKNTLAITKSDRSSTVSKVVCKKKIFTRFVTQVLGLFNKPFRVTLILLAIAIGIGGCIGITHGVWRPYENGVVIAYIQNLEEQPFNDALSNNLSMFIDVIESEPVYYKEEVRDIDTARKAALDKNQRFVIWGNMWIEEGGNEENFIATVYINVFDAEKGKPTFTPRDYEYIEKLKSDLVRRVADDYSPLVVYYLGLSELYRGPTNQSVVSSSKTFTPLSIEEIYKNNLKAQRIGILLQDKAFEQLYKWLMKDNIDCHRKEEILNDAISAVSQLEQFGFDGNDLKPALAKLYAYRGAFQFFHSGLKMEIAIEKAERDLERAKQLDNSFPVTHYYLWWIGKAGEESKEDRMKHACDFLCNIEERYGGLVEDYEGVFPEMTDQIKTWLENYIKEHYEGVSPEMTEQIKAWLEKYMKECDTDQCKAWLKNYIEEHYAEASYWGRPFIIKLFDL